MSGKRGVAPCGHEGTHVIGQYVACDRRCGLPREEAVPEFIDPEKTLPICPKCGASDTEIYPGSGAIFVQALWHCNGCGKSFLT